MEYGAIFIIIALAAFMGSYLGNKASAPKATAVCNNDVALPPPPPPKAASRYRFEYESFTLDVKTEDGLTLDDFDQNAIRSRFESFARQEEQNNNRCWEMFIVARQQRNGNFYAYYQATFDDYNYSKDVKDRQMIWFAINDALIYAFERISKHRDDDRDDNGKDTDPNDPLGSAVDKLFEN